MLLLEQYEDYFSRAKMMTEIHARPSHKSEHHGASSSGLDSNAHSSNKGITAGVKRPAANASGVDRKKKDKKKALKRL